MEEGERNRERVRRNKAKKLGRRERRRQMVKIVTITKSSVKINRKQMCAYMDIRKADTNTKKWGERGEPR